MQIQRLILEDADTTYDVLVEPTQPIQATQPNQPGDDLESYDPNVKRSLTIPTTVPPEVRVKLADVHRTIQGYTQYAIGAFKNLAIADVEEVNLKFNIKISAEGGIPVIASGKTESDFSIEVKCKFPKQEKS
ncbi:CU044_2847 family protein [Alkalinema pantanalense CENA528]|uniref:CU044_2847 family protein n=1 Tax=Alkalinema pantanalense TaxID=1620705 RepID=UPI003D6F72C8